MLFRISFPLFLERKINRSDSIGILFPSFKANNGYKGKIIEVMLNPEGHQKTGSFSDSSGGLHVCSARSHWWNQQGMP